MFTLRFICRSLILAGAIPLFNFFLSGCQSSTSSHPGTSQTEIALRDCVQAGDATCVKERLNSGLNPDAHDSVNSVLIVAIKAGNNEIARLLINQGANLNVNTAQPNSNVSSPFHTAISQNNSELVSYMIEKGADVNKVNPQYKLTPLMMAVQSQNVDIAKILLAAGADKNQFNPDGKTAVEMASELKNENLITLLDSRGQWSLPTPELCEAVASKNFARVKELIDGGTSVNQTDAKGRTPIMIAIANTPGTREIRELIMSQSPDVNISDDQGETPLLLAAKKGDSSLVQDLLDKGARVNAEAHYTDPHADKVDKLNYAFYHGAPTTPLMAAVDANDPFSAELLLEKGADVSAKNALGISVLMVAVKKRNPELVQMLIDKYAHVNDRSKNGWTALKLLRETNQLPLKGPVREIESALLAVDAIE